MSFYHDFVYWLTIKPRLKKLQELLPEAEISPAGSRYVCDPPFIGTDVDFLVYSDSPVSGRLNEAGYTETPFRDYGGTSMKAFSAWRKGVVNLIVPDTREYADTFNTATCICKQYNLRRKYHRIIVHEVLSAPAILYPMQEDMPLPLQNLLQGLLGPYRAAIYKAYRIQHGLN